MKKTIGVIIVMGLFLSAFSGIPVESERAEYYSDFIYYTIKRDVYSGIFDRIPFSDEVIYSEGLRGYRNIVFTKVFARIKSTGRTELLFEFRKNIWAYEFIDGRFYLLTIDGLYTCGIDGGNLELLIPGRLACFTMNDSEIYYCIYNNEIERYQIVKCGLDGSNKSVFADGIGTSKITIVEDGLIISDMVDAGKVSMDGQAEFFITNLSFPTIEFSAENTGTHFVIGDYLILTGYMSPEDGKYGEFPTLICDLDGNVLDVWGNTVIRSVHESEGRTYVYISYVDNLGNYLTYEDEREISRSTGGMFLISHDLKEVHRVTQSYGFKCMYIKENELFYCGNSGTWYRCDLLPDGSIENDEAEPRFEYFDEIEVLVTYDNPIDEITPDSYMVQFRGTLLAFDIPPTIIEEEVLLPARKVFESMGAKVTWDDDARKATVEYGETELVFEEGCCFFYRNGVEIPLMIPAQIISGRLQVPLQAFTDGIGAQTEWNEARKAVWIWYS